VRNFLFSCCASATKRGVPATSFIVTGESFTQEDSKLNGNWSPEDDAAYLSWSEVRQLADQGLDFGSHTCTHAALPDIPPAQARTELQESLDALGTYLGPQDFPCHILTEELRKESVDC